MSLLTKLASLGIYGFKQLSLMAVGLILCVVVLACAFTLVNDFAALRDLEKTATSGTYVKMIFELLLAVVAACGVWLVVAASRTASTTNK